jgi:hypothetical protein
MAWPDYIEGSQQSYLKKVPLPSRRPPILPFHKIGKMSIFLSKQTNKQTNKLLLLLDPRGVVPVEK